MGSWSTEHIIFNWLSQKTIDSIVTFWLIYNISADLFRHHSRRDHDRELPLHVHLQQVHPHGRRRPHETEVLRQVRHRNRKRPKDRQPEESQAHCSRQARGGRLTVSLNRISIGEKTKLKDRNEWKEWKWSRD